MLLIFMFDLSKNHILEAKMQIRLCLVIYRFKFFFTNLIKKQNPYIAQVEF